MWIAHISDTHIRPSGVLYQGVVDSNRMLATAILQINALDPPADLALLTGDIVDEAKPADYAMARELLAVLHAPLRIIPGNHDERAACRAAFRDHPYLPASGPFNFVDDCSGPVRVVALDVTLPGHHHGEVDDDALGWLDGVLASNPDRPTLLMMHQPPFACGVPYLDPDPQIQQIISSWPRKLQAPRAEALGFSADAGVDEAVHAFIEDDLEMQKQLV